MNTWKRCQWTVHACLVFDDWRGYSLIGDRLLLRVQFRWNSTRRFHRWIVSHSIQTGAAFLRFLLRSIRVQLIETQRRRNRWWWCTEKKGRRLNGFMGVGKWGQMGFLLRLFDWWNERFFGWRRRWRRKRGLTRTGRLAATSLFWASRDELAKVRFRDRLTRRGSRWDRITRFIEQGHTDDRRNEGDQQRMEEIRSERISVNAIRLLSEEIFKRNVLIGGFYVHAEWSRRHTRSESIHFLLNRVDWVLMVGRLALKFPSLRWCSRNTERISRLDPNVPKRTIISSTIRTGNSFCQYLRLFGRVNTNTPTSDLTVCSWRVLICVMSDGRVDETVAVEVHWVFSSVCRQLLGYVSICFD